MWCAQCAGMMHMTTGETGVRRWRMDTAGGGPRGPQESTSERGRTHKFSKTFLGERAKVGRHGVAVDLGVATVSTKSAQLAGGGPSVPGASAARGYQWERPVKDLGVHNMAWPADMHMSYRGRH